MPGLPFDPLKVFEEVIVIIVVILLIIFLIKYKSRVIMALTGDDRIHGTTLDLGWFCCFRCCGNCSGEWTRLLTTFPFCPKTIRGQNIVKWVGRQLGMATHTVEISNIVVGDLPFQSNKRGDFYLSVECAANPPMMTSLAEEKLPKVVHFPEIITLRIRNSPLEDKVVFHVKELNVLGSEDLCSISVSAQQMIDWMDDDIDVAPDGTKPATRAKRLEMKPVNDDLERETQPWILITVSADTESRQLDTFYGNVNSTVRTTDRQGNNADMKMTNFKSVYTLLDPTGHPLQEPDDNDLESISYCRKSVNCFLWLYNFLVFAVVIVFLSFRFYIWSCYRQFTWITMGAYNNYTFPMSTASAKSLVHHCQDQVRGTGAEVGIPCRPSNPQIQGVCENLPLGQPRPTAFTAIVKEYTGWDRKWVPCYDGLCRQRNEYLNGKDPAFFSLCGIAVISTWPIKWIGDKMIKNKKRRCIQNSTNRHNTTRTMMQDPGARGLQNPPAGGARGGLFG